MPTLVMLPPQSAITREWAAKLTAAYSRRLARVTDSSLDAA